MDLQQELRGILPCLPTLYSELQRNMFSSSSDVVGKMRQVANEKCTQLYWYVMITDIQSAMDPTGLGSHLTELMGMYQRMLEHYDETLNALSIQQQEGQRCLTAATLPASGRGRPRYLVRKEQLIFLKELGFSWARVALMLGISRSTLDRRRKELDIPVDLETFSDISDNELDDVVQQILRDTPNSGEVMVIGALVGRGIRVQRRRARESIWRVDPVGREMRRRFTVRRRVYNVSSPNALW